MTILLYLFAGHALFDYPLQGDFLAKGKNRKLLGEGWFGGWWKAMLAHCFMQSAMVLVVTGSVPMALAELVIHLVTDISKCEGLIDSNIDQAIHYGCKLLWAGLVWRAA